MIPKKIFTIWLNDKLPIPELAERCIVTQKSAGFEHKVVTFFNSWEYVGKSKYLQECLEAGRWVKAADFLRMAILFKEGGIYLDADIEVLKPFDDLLDVEMFVGQESNGIFSNAVVGSVAGHPLLEEYLRRIEQNFKGGGDLVFEPGIRAFADLIWLQKWNVTVHPPERFYGNDYTIHHEMRSWK